MTENLDYIAALLHGRRSRMVEGERLRKLCWSKTVAELGRDALGGLETTSARDLERHLVQSLAREMAELAPQLPGPVTELLEWLAGRFQLEDLKLLVRRLVTKAPLEQFRTEFQALCVDPRLDVEALAKADSLEALVQMLPRGAWRRSLAKATGSFAEQPAAFYLESALDRSYLAGLLAKADAFAGEDGDLIRAIAVQDLDIFHLMLVTRGRLIYGLEPKTLWPFHLPRTRISRTLFDDLLTETDIRVIGARLIGCVIDSLGNVQTAGEAAETAIPGLLERLAWSRFQRLANRAFRRSHMGDAMVVAFFALRRVETANLIAICEGIRAGLPPEGIHARLIPLRLSEPGHV